MHDWFSNFAEDHDHFSLYIQCHKSKYKKEYEYQCKFDAISVSQLYLHMEIDQ